VPILCSDIPTILPVTGLRYLFSAFFSFPTSDFSRLTPYDFGCNNAIVACFKTLYAGVFTNADAYRGTRFRLPASTRPIGYSTFPGARFSKNLRTNLGET